MSSTQFTPSQLEDFKKYVKVQKQGRYNMFDPRARALTSLPKDRYIFVIDNYEALQAASVVKTAGQALEKACPFGYRSTDGP